MRLEERRAIQQVPGGRLVEVYLQVLFVSKPDRRIAEIICIGKCGVRGLGANVGEALDISRAASDDIHRRLGVRHAGGISRAIVNREKPLGVVNMAEDSQVDAILVKEPFKRCLARCTTRASSGVPRSMPSNNEPGCDGTVDGSKIRLEELELLIGSAEGSAVEALRTIGPVWGIGEIRLGVNHDNVRHSILEREPERRFGELLSLVRIDLCRVVCRGGSEHSGHSPAKSVDEITDTKVLA